MFSIVLLGSCQKDIEGCTDATAVNYNPDANIDNSTCQYLPTISTIPVVYNTGTTAESGGIITSDGGSQITIKGVCWSNSPNPTINNDTTINGTGVASFDSYISNLNLNSTYYLRAYATNSNGTGYGDELSFTTENLVLINYQNFEQALIDLGYDNLIDGFLTPSIIENVIDLSIVNKNISDMTGIEAFVSLNTLNCTSNQLTALDITQNTALTSLDCRSNQLTALDITQNAALNWIDIGDNLFTNLDFSNNSLTTIYCRNNNSLINLNLSNNSLSSVNVQDNPLLNDLDVSNNSIDYFYCENNDVLTNINLTHCNVTQLFCNNNQVLSVLDLSNLSAGNSQLLRLEATNNQLTGLNLSNCPNLQIINCYGNQLSCVNLKNGNNSSISSISFSFNPSLSCIEVDNPNYSNIWWSWGSTSGITFSTNCNYPAGCF